MEGKYNQIHQLLSAGSYPKEFDKSKRQNLRRYASKFTLRDGELFFGDRRAVRQREEARNLFVEFHASPMGGHTGLHKTRQAMCARYWHGMSLDIEKWTQECDQCQRVGKPLAAVTPLQCIKVSTVWELVGIDLPGPLPETAAGYHYVLTATDYFSKWVEAYSLRTKSAVEVAENLCKIIYRHGCPARILSDQGREFVNELNTRLCDLLNIQRSVTAAYHPQTNGLDEKTNDNIKRALRKLVNDQQTNWDTFLDATLFSLRSKVHTTIKHSPFRLMYGREARFPSEVPATLPLSMITLPEESGYSDFNVSRDQAHHHIHQSAKESMERGQEKQIAAYAKKIQKKYKGMQYKVGDEILLLNGRKSGREGGRLQPDFSGPYRIENIFGKRVTLSSNGKMLLTKYSTHHIKPYRRPEKIGKTDFVQTDRQAEERPPRPSVIQFAKRAETAIDPPPPAPLYSISTASTSTMLSTHEKAQILLDESCVEAVIGPYKLYTESFKSLQNPTGWLTDEVIDAYLHSLISKHKTPLHLINAVVSTDLFSGRFRCLRKMKLPVQDIWLCPVNFSSHWILVIVSIPTKTLVLIDPIGNEKSYERRVLRNWRNFRKLAEICDGPWRVENLEHHNQQDSSSCGVLVLKFAEHFLCGAIGGVLTTAEAVLLYRQLIACTLLEHQGNADDICVVCSMLEADANRSSNDMHHNLEEMRQALLWMESNVHVFQGRVQLPSFLCLGSKEALGSLCEDPINEEDRHTTMDPFLFKFENALDLNTFMVGMEKGVGVHCGME